MDLAIELSLLIYSFEFLLILVAIFYFYIKYLLKIINKIDFIGLSCSTCIVTFAMI